MEDIQILIPIARGSKNEKEKKGSMQVKSMHIQLVKKKRTSYLSGASSRSGWKCEFLRKENRVWQCPPCLP